MSRKISITEAELADFRAWQATHVAAQQASTTTAVAQPAVAQPTAAKVWEPLDFIVHYLRGAVAQSLRCAAHYTAQPSAMSDPSLSERERTTIASVCAMVTAGKYPWVNQMFSLPRMIGENSIPSLLECYATALRKGHIKGNVAFADAIRASSARDVEDGKPILSRPVRYSTGRWGAILAVTEDYSKALAANGGTFRNKATSATAVSGAPKKVLPFGL